MYRALSLFASIRLMLGGFGLLALGAIAGYGDEGASVWLTAAPLSLLAVNLAAALLLHRRLRRGALGAFHATLLALLVLAAFGRLTRLEGRIELAENAAFDAASVVIQTRGPLHRDRLADVQFVQGPYQVSYAPGVRRAHTRSEVLAAGAAGEILRVVVGDDTPLLRSGYRFYTTHNKGFAPVVTWQAHGGDPVTGALHMPSYPMFDWKQENRWTPAYGREMRFFLRVEPPLDEHKAWTLVPGATPATLVVHAEGKRAVLAVGEAMALDSGTLRFERVSGWMGYRIFHDPTLPWLLLVSVVAVGALAWHLWLRLAGQSWQTGGCLGDEVGAT